MCSHSKELPLYKDCHRGWRREEQQENRELFSTRIPHLRHTNPHVRCGGDKPDDDKRDGRCDHRRSVRAGKELGHSKTGCPQPTAMMIAVRMATSRRFLLVSEMVAEI